MRTRLVAFVFVALASAACGGGQAAAPAPPHDMNSMSMPSSTSAQPDAPLVPNGEAKVGDHTKCPVSGHAFLVTDQTPKVEYNGKTYYFCCQDCPKEFQANPEKYIHGA